LFFSQLVRGARVSLMYLSAQEKVMSDIRGYAAPPRMAGNNTGRIIAAVIVVAAIAGIGGYAYSTGAFHSHQPKTVQVTLPSS
jgi:hypothetical protein